MISPPITVVEEPDLTFKEALDAVLAGKRISKREWDDVRKYGILKDTFLMYHKAGESDETLHFWIINDGDIVGTDYFVLN